MQIHTLRLFVNDLAAAAVFYGQTLALEAVCGSPHGGFCVYRSGALELVLESVPPNAPSDDQALVGRFTGVSFAVTDMGTAFKRLQDRGVVFTGLPERQEWGGILASFTDPAGNTLQLVQAPSAAAPLSMPAAAPLPRSSWSPSVATTPFQSLPLPSEVTVQAPDGSDVRVLLGLAGGTLAHFELASGAVTKAVVHRTVEEIWYVLSGEGAMWRRQGDREEVVALKPGLSITIPLGTHFQFRATAPEPLRAVAITMPPWPGPDEAVEVPGPWEPLTPRP